MWTLLNGHDNGDADHDADHHQHPPLLSSRTQAGSAGSAAAVVTAVAVAGTGAGATSSPKAVYEWWHTRALFHHYLANLICTGPRTGDDGCGLGFGSDSGPGLGSGLGSGLGPGLGTGVCDPSLVTELLELSLLLATEMAQGTCKTYLQPLHTHTRTEYLT